MPKRQHDGADDAARTAAATATHRAPAAAAAAPSSAGAAAPPGDAAAPSIAAALPLSRAAAVATSGGKQLGNALRSKCASVSATAIAERLAQLQVQQQQQNKAASSAAAAAGTATIHLLVDVSEVCTGIGSRERGIEAGLIAMCEAG